MIELDTAARRATVASLTHERALMPIALRYGPLHRRLYALGDGKPSRAERNPANRVIGRWIVAPGFASPQAHGQVVY